MDDIRNDHGFSEAMRNVVQGRYRDAVQVKFESGRSIKDGHYYEKPSGHLMRGGHPVVWFDVQNLDGCPFAVLVNGRCTPSDLSPFRVRWGGGDQLPQFVIGWNQGQRTADYVDYSAAINSALDLIEQRGVSI